MEEEDREVSSKYQNVPQIHTLVLICLCKIRCASTTPTMAIVLRATLVQNRTALMGFSRQVENLKNPKVQLKHLSLGQEPGAGKEKEKEEG